LDLIAEHEVFGIFHLGRANQFVVCGAALGLSAAAMAVGVDKQLELPTQIIMASKSIALTTSSSSVPLTSRLDYYPA
jgi:hypothetical protein